MNNFIVGECLKEVFALLFYSSCKVILVFRFLKLRLRLQVLLDLNSLAREENVGDSIEVLFRE